MSVQRIASAVAGAAVVTLAASAARADKPFVDRSLTLPVLHVAADAGVGFGQYQPATTDSAGNTTLSGQKLGWGSSLEGAVGLPFVGEFGARFGYRFDDGGAVAQADHFGRLFDPVVNEPGLDRWTNPELYLRGTLVAIDVLEVGLETRAILPTAQGSNLALTPGIPVRVHLPGLARIDTGLYFPVAPFDNGASFVLQVPAQLFFQAGQAFFGPLTGFRYVDGLGPPNPSIVAGVGCGYTLLGMIDLKVQVYSEAINDARWADHIGGGIGVGLRIP